MKLITKVAGAVLLSLSMAFGRSMDSREGDSLALVAIKDTNGTNQSAYSTWLDGLPIDQWSGVKINSNDRVEDITFTVYQLPNEVGNLTNLTRLETAGFNPITAEIGKMAKLKSLTIRDYRSNTFPETIKNLGSLSYLYLEAQLHGHKIQDVVAEITSLDTLKIKPFNDYSYAGIPMEIGNLINLKYLYIEQVSSTDLPASLGKLESLEKLDLQKLNSIESLPAEIGSLSGLKELNINSLPLLKSLPEEMSNLSTLEKLSVYQCHLLTSIPSTLGNLTNLSLLHINQTSVSAIPTSVKSLQNLTSLSLSNNKITELPAEIGSCVNLSTLNLSSNQLTVLPPELGNCSSLASLDIRSNQLKTIPTELLNCTELKGTFVSGVKYYLDLSNNLIDSIPGEYANASFGLSIRNNRLIKIPEQLAINNKIFNDVAGNRFNSATDSITAVYTTIDYALQTGYPDSTKKNPDLKLYLPISGGVFSYGMEYTPEQLTISTASNSSAPIRFNSTNTSVVTIDPETGIITVVGAGKAVIQCSQEATEEFNPAKHWGHEVTVLPKELTLSGELTVTNKVYDGTDTAVVDGFAILDGVVAGDENDVKFVNKGKYSDKNVGVNKAVTIVLEGSKAGNYKTNDLQLRGAITARPATYSGLTVVNGKVYDGNSIVTLAQKGTITGILPGDIVTLQDTAFVSDKVAGTDKSVMLQFAGKDVSNYSITKPSILTATITQRPIMVTGLQAKTKEYDGNNSASLTGSATITGLVQGDIISFNAVFDSINAGIDIPVTLGIIGTDGNNYMFGIPESSTLGGRNIAISSKRTTLKATITPKPITLLIVDTMKHVGDDDPMYTVTSADFVNSDNSSVISGLEFSRELGEEEGTYAISASGGTARNYIVTSITPGVLTIKNPTGIIDQGEFDIANNKLGIYPLSNPVDRFADGVEIVVSAGRSAMISLAVFDLLGNLIDEQQLPTETDGNRLFRWDICNKLGVRVTSGSYKVLAQIEYSEGTRKTVSTVIGVKE